MNDIIIMKNDYEKYLELNRRNWNLKTKLHYGSEFYDVENFKKKLNSLNDIEIKGLGDIENRSILHLQCHFGMDTLSLAKKGARCIGIDFSETAIKQAVNLNEELQLDAKFICSNIYDLKEKLDQQFDIVFTSYGTYGWLPDIESWANIISHFLKPGGIFYIVDFHPFIFSLDDNFSNFGYNYFFDPKPIVDVSKGTYADRDADIVLTEYGWNHSLSEVISSLLNNSQSLIEFNEYPYSTYNCFPNMIEIKPGQYVFEKFKKNIPYLFSIKTKKCLNNR